MTNENSTISFESEVLVIGIFFESNFTFSRKYKKDNLETLYKHICEEANIKFDQILIVYENLNIKIYEELELD